MPQSLEQMRKKEAQLKEQIKDLQAKKRKAERKQDAHEKIVAGAIFLKALKPCDWLDLTDEEVLTKLANHLADQVINKGFPKDLARPGSATPQQQPERPYHVRGSLAEILGDDIEVTPIKEKWPY